MRASAVDIIRELDKDSIRQNLRRFTWQAWQALPAIPRPRLLDLGCGSGVPTIELAVLSKGRITAVDRDRAALARLKEKAAALGLRKNIRTMAGDITGFRSRPGAFDVVWCEGAIAAVGFERGLELWRRLLKPMGYMVIHDEIKDHERKLAAVTGLGYELLSHFILPVDVWLSEYFRPLGQSLHELAAKYAERPDLLELLRKEECEIEIFKERPDDFASIFYIMRKAVQNRK